MPHSQTLSASLASFNFRHVFISVERGVKPPRIKNLLANIGTKPSFGQSAVNVELWKNWPCGGLRDRLGNKLARGSDFVEIGSHAKTAAAVP